MPTPQRSSGNRGESIAVQHLEKNGFQILERNFLVREGEIDIVAQKKNILHFIEVKTRKSNSYGEPIESISEEKLEKLSQAIEKYLQKNQIPEEMAYQLDLITIDLMGKKQEIEHYEHIFL